MNFGFSILHNTPQILLYDITSPAGESIRNSYGLVNLLSLFSTRFIKTYTVDIEYLFTYIIYIVNMLRKTPKRKLSQ